MPISINARWREASLAWRGCMKSRVLRGVAIAILASLLASAASADACADFALRPEFEDLRKDVSEGKYGLIDEPLRQALAGEECSSEAIVSMMEEMGWKYKGKIEHQTIVNTTRFDYDGQIQFCHKVWNVLTVFMRCSGLSDVYRRENEVVWVSAHANI